MENGKENKTGYRVEQDSIGAKDIPGDVYYAVSYTHLDVYKRQLGMVIMMFIPSIFIGILIVLLCLLVGYQLFCC